MKVDINPEFSALFIEHDKDPDLEITIKEDGTIDFYWAVMALDHDFEVSFTGKELQWLASKAGLFSMRRYRYLQKKKEREE